MEILTITSEYSTNILGGLGTHVTNLTNELSKISNENITVATFKYPGSEYVKQRNKNNRIEILNCTAEKSNGLDNFFCVNDSNFELIKKVLNLNKDFNLIHVHDFPSANAGMILSDILDVPLVTTVHDTLLGRFGDFNNLNEIGKYYATLQKKLVIKSDCVICCSNSIQQELISNYGLNKNKINVIPNGIIPENRFNFNRNIDKNEKHTTRLLYVGRMNKDKGLMVLIRAIYKLDSLGYSIKLTIVGNHKNKYSNVLIKEIEKMNLSKHITFAGFKSGEKLKKIYQSQDLVIIPSLYEPFGIVLLESINFGTPVIFSNTGGLLEVGKRLGLNRSYFVSNDVESLFKKILNFIDDNDSIDRITNDLLKRMRNEFSWKVIASRTNIIYRKVIENG